MIHTVEQAKDFGAGYGTAAVPPSHNSRIEEYISQLDSATGEVENQLDELRRRLSSLLLPEVDILSENHCVPLPAMSEAAYRIHRTVERLENLRKCLGDILSRI